MNWIKKFKFSNRVVCIIIYPSSHSSWISAVLEMKFLFVYVLVFWKKFSCIIKYLNNNYFCISKGLHAKRHT